MEKLIQQLAGNSSADQCIGTLQSIKIQIQNKEITEQQGFQIVEAILAKIEIGKDSVDFDVAVAKALALILQSVDWNTLTQKYPQILVLLQKALQSDKDEQQQACLQVIKTSKQLPFPVDLIKLIGRTESVKVAEVVTEILVSQADNEALLSTQANEAFMQLVHSQSSVTQFRGYQAVASIGSQNSAFLVQYTPIIRMIITHVQSKDVLNQLNAVIVLECVASIPSGKVLLEHNGVIDELAKYLNDTSSMEGQMLQTSVVSFFGAFCNDNQRLKAFQDRYSYVKKLTKYLEQGPYDLQVASASAVSQCATSADSLMFLESHGTLKALMILYGTLSREGKVPIIKALTTVLLNSDEEAYGTVVKQRMYDRLKGSPLPLDSIVSDALSSFDNLKQAAMQLLLAMAKHKFGLTAFKTHRSFIEAYLLKRATEDSYQGKVMKFDLIKQVLQTSQKYLGILEPQQVALLQRYVNEGCFYSANEASVAVM